MTARRMSQPGLNGERDKEPVTVILRDSYATGPQEWSMTVTSIGPDIGALNIRIMNPDPNNKIKKHLPHPCGQYQPRGQPVLPRHVHPAAVRGPGRSRKIWTDKPGMDATSNSRIRQRTTPPCLGIRGWGVPVVPSQSGGRSSKKLKMVSYMDSTFDGGDVIQRHHHRCLYPNQARGAMTRWMRPKQAAAGKRRGRFPAMGGAPCRASALHTYRGKGNAAASSLVWMTTSFWVGLVMAT